MCIAAAFRNIVCLLRLGSCSVDILADSLLTLFYCISGTFHSPISLQQQRLSGYWRAPRTIGLYNKDCWVEFSNSDIRCVHQYLQYSEKEFASAFSLLRAPPSALTPKMLVGLNKWEFKQGLSGDANPQNLHLPLSGLILKIAHQQRSLQTKVQISRGDCV